MNVVSRFEANLLRLLNVFLRRAPAEQARPLATAGAKAPPCLSRTAVALVRDALAKGTVHLLARGGGWRRERFLRGERPAEGRLWERTAPAELGLTFTGEALAFLIWVTAADAKAPGATPWEPGAGGLAVGDLVLLYFAYAALREAGLHGDLALPSRAAFFRHGLCRLAFPEDFGGAGAGESPDFVPWTVGVGAGVLEALQPELAARWLHVEGDKENVADFAVMRAVGRSQECVLGAFLKAADAADRHDLARFLLEAAAGLLTPGATPGNWVGALATVAGQRLADRAETHRAATAFLRQLDRLKAWEGRARATGYLDEGYHAGQLWLADWERFDGDALHARAGAIVRHLDPLKPSEGSS